MAEAERTGSASPVLGLHWIVALRGQSALFTAEEARRILGIKEP